MEYCSLANYNLNLVEHFFHLAKQSLTKRWIYIGNKTIANLKQMPHLHKFPLVCFRAKIDFAPLSTHSADGKCHICSRFVLLRKDHAWHNFFMEFAYGSNVVRMRCFWLFAYSYFN